MPRNPTDEKWVDRIRGIVANTPRKAVAQVHEDLEKVAVLRGESLSQVPSESTIRRIRDRFPADERSPYRFVHWPETFERGDLPWEAAESALALFASFEAPGRPPVRLAYWYWRLTDSGVAPDLAFSLALAMSAAIPDSPGFTAASRSVEDHLLGRAGGAGLEISPPDSEYLADLRAMTQVHFKEERE